MLHVTPRPQDPEEIPAEGPDSPGPEEIAARWEQIVADLSGPDGLVARGREGEGRTRGPDAAGPGGPARPGDDDAGWVAEEEDDGWGEALARPAGDPATDFRAWHPAEDPDEDHFVPPDPEPLGGDPMLSLSWAVIIAVPLFLLFAVVAWPTVPGLLLAAAGAAWLAALGALVWRMPHRRDDDDGPGAVV